MPAYNEELNNSTLVLLTQMAAGEWDGPAALTQWFNNERGPSSDSLPECSVIGIQERRRLICELAACVWSAIEEWGEEDHGRFEYLYYENPGWGDWDFGFIPRLICEAFAAESIHEGNVELLDEDETWGRINHRIRKLCDGWRATFETEEVNDNPIADMDTIDETVRMGRDLIAIIIEAEHDFARYEDQWTAFMDRLLTFHFIETELFVDCPWVMKATQSEIVDMYIRIVEDNGAGKFEVPSNPFASLDD